MCLCFLSFWHFGPSFLFILAFCAFVSFHFGILGIHFLAFWLFGGQLLEFLLTSCKKRLVFLRNIQRIYQPQDRLHLAIFSFLGLHFLSFLPFRLLFPFILALWAFISFHFGIVGLHFLLFWPCGPSFPFILALRAFIAIHFDFLGLHFLSFWLFGPSFPCILAFWAFNSLHSCLHFLSFWPCGPSFRFHFGLVGLGLHFLSFWLFALSFPFILALSAFISLHFGFLCLCFLSFWPCGPSFPCILALWSSASGARPTSCRKRSVFLRIIQRFY